MHAAVAQDNDLFVWGDSEPAPTEWAGHLKFADARHGLDKPLRYPNLKDILIIDCVQTSAVVGPCWPA